MYQRTRFSTISVSGWYRRCLSRGHSLTRFDFRLKPSPLLLFYHFFRVAFYSIYILFVTPIRTPEDPKGHMPQLLDFPALSVQAVKVFWTACVVLLPILWTEGQM